MGLSKFKHVKITGISTVVPEKEISIYDEAEYYDNNIKKIDRMHKMVGFHKRRVVENDVTPSDLGIQAAENLISNMNIDKNSIDALVYMCQQPDFQAPATAFYIHHKLGLSQECTAFDVNQGCPAWVYGLWISSQMIESGTNKRILLIAADTPARFMNKEDRISAPIFGDGGTATLLEYSDEIIESFYNIETHSKDYEAILTPLINQRNTINFYDEKDKEMLKSLMDNHIQTSFGHKAFLFNGYMDGIAVFNFTMSVVPKNIKELLKYADKSHEDILALCLHQGNKQIVQTVGSEAGFEEANVPYYAFENYGNNTMCSIPTTINSVYGQEVSTQKNTFACSGFGNGLACASVILVLDKIYSSGVRDYQLPEDHMTRDEFIAYWTKKLQGEKKGE